MFFLAVELRHFDQLVPLGGVSLRAFGEFGSPGLVDALGGPAQGAVRQPGIDRVNGLHQSSRFLPVDRIEKVPLYLVLRHEIAEDHAGFVVQKSFSV